MIHPSLQASIIIVVKNDRGIDATLAHLEEMNNEAVFETIVIDASEQARLSDIRAKYPTVRWYQFPPSNQRTTPAQRNRGLDLAQSPLIVFLDANCVPAKGWLAAIISSIDAGEDIVCGPVLDLSKHNLVHYHPDITVGTYIDVCTTISVGIRRSVFNSVGQFDTSFSFGQDVDFFWRATDKGYRIYHNPLMVIGHNWGAPNEQLTRAFQYGKARAHLFKKHWRSRRGQLRDETHVWIYPLFILSLPITFLIHLYPLLIVIPALKNRFRNPLGLILHHLAYGVGVIAGVLKRWPLKA